MQSFPFLVAQNTPSRNKPALAAEQKSVEPVTPFKQVLSQQVRQELAKGKVPGRDKAPHKPSSAQSQAESRQVKPPKKVEDKNTTGAALAEDKEILSKWQHKATKSVKHQDDASLMASGFAPIDQAANVIAIQAPQTGGVLAQASALLPDTVPAETTLSTESRPDALKPTVSDITSGNPTPNPTATGSESKVYDKQVSGSDHGVKMNSAHQSPDQLQSFSAHLSVSQDRLTGDLPGLLEQVNMGKHLQEVAAPPAMMTALTPLQAQQAAAVSSLPGSSNLIEAYPGKSGWDQAISQKVVWMVGSAEQSATLTLNPPELGPLQVVISVNNEKADTTFISENPDVRKALEDGIPALRDLMSEAGVQLGQANVSTGRQQEAFQQSRGEQRNLAHSPSGLVAQDDDKPQTGRVTTRVQNGLVDTFA